MLLFLSKAIGSLLGCLRHCSELEAANSWPGICALATSASLGALCLGSGPTWTGPEAAPSFTPLVPAASPSLLAHDGICWVPTWPPLLPGGPGAQFSTGVVSLALNQHSRLPHEQDIQSIRFYLRSIHCKFWEETEPHPHPLLVLNEVGKQRSGDTTHGPSHFLPSPQQNFSSPSVHPTPTGPRFGLSMVVPHSG